MKLKELEKRLKQEPDNLGLRVQVAGLMREAGRSVEAVELYRSVALAYRDQGRTQQAIAVCRSILEIAPDDAACQGLLAMLQGRGTPSRPPATEPTSHSPLPPEKVPIVPSLRPATKPPARTPTHPPEAQGRSSFDETPLPKPIPYHVSDPTSQPNKVSAVDLDLPAVEGADTRPGDEERRATAGLAQAARRISGLISDSRSVPESLDMSAELDTRQRRLIKTEELHKIDLPPPTVPIERVDDDEDDEVTAPPPSYLRDELATDRTDVLTPPPRGSSSDDMLTPPPRGSDDAITPPPLTGAVPKPLPKPTVPTVPRPSRPPPVVAIPPKPPPRSAQGSTPAASRSTPPPLPHISHDSDDELTSPHDRNVIDDDDD